MLDSLDDLYNMYDFDKSSYNNGGGWGSPIYGIQVKEELCKLGLAFRNPEYPEAIIITQLGADYLGKDEKIITPFDRELAYLSLISQLTAELERSNKANADIAAKLKIADAGWSECIDEVNKLDAEIAVLRQDSGIPF